VAGATLVAQVAKPAAPAPAASTVSADPNKVVLQVGDSKMTVGEYENFVANLPAEVQAMARGPAKRRIAEDLVKLKVLAAEAKKQGLDQTVQFKQQMELMRDNALAGALINSAQGKLVGDQDVEKYYNEHKAEFERATARHILIPVGGAGGQTDEQAKTKADAIKKRLDKGEDFAAIAKAESADPGSKDDGGMLQPFGRGQMVPEFEQVAFSQKDNAISPPVKTRFGYHIIQTIKKETQPLADVKDEIGEILRPQKVEAMVEQLKKDAKVQLDESFFGPPVAAPAPGAMPPGHP
jgi:peptidyl-prolyl cis-trans isomerase C